MTGKLFVVSGPSGAGKGTLLAQVINELGNVHIAVSATTRRPRRGEKDGVQYFFLSNEKFDELISIGGLLEWANVHGAHYGTLKAEVLSQLAAGQDVLLEIDPQGARQVKEKYPEAVLVFIKPPSLEVLKDRLQARNTETEEEIATRLDTAQQELASEAEYDKVIINDQVDVASRELADYILQKRDS